MTPEARKHGVLVQEVGTELVVYDETNNAAHRLNKTASLVWRACDGRTSVAALAQRLNGQLDVVDDDDQQVVRFALDRLERARLLVPATAAPTGTPIGRREALSRLRTAALLPVVASIVVSTPERAAATFHHFGPTAPTPIPEPDPTPPPPPDLTLTNGTYTGTVTKTEGDNTTVVDMTTGTVTSQVDMSGNGTAVTTSQLLMLYPAFDRNYTITAVLSSDQTSVTFTGSGAGSAFNHDFTCSVGGSYSADGTTVMFTETINFSDGTSVTYMWNLTSMA